MRRTPPSSVTIRALLMVVGPVLVSGALSVVFGGCAGPRIRPDRWVAPDTFSAARSVSDHAVIAALSAAETAALAEANDCVELQYQLTVCPTEIKLEEWAWQHHVREPVEAELAADLDPPDPVVIRDGLEIYEELLTGVARRTRVHLDLLEHTPVLNEAEVRYFREHPEVWAETVAYRSAPSGQQQRRRFQAAFDRITSRDGRRHLLLRNGYFYIEDPITADWVAGHVELRDLFDAPSLLLTRGSRTYHLERGSDGRYFHTEPEFDSYRARLLIFDRLALPDEQQPASGYNLHGLRRQLGLAHIEVGQESGAGRSGEAVFLNGSHYPTRLIRIEPGVSAVGLIAQPAELATVLETSWAQAEVIYGLMEVAEQMVRENLFFDEPANEIGQQDGIMRLAFHSAYERGQERYTVNRVTYDIFDDLGRPRPPQVCVDYLTDMVERYTGSWWPRRSEGERQKSDGLINMRDYLRYRQVRRLVKLAEDWPWVASVLHFGPSAQIQFRDRGAFFRNLWNHRDEFRIGDMVVIYGLKADDRNHYHSFYVHDTDPVYGVPITLTDQAGHARITSWTDVMSTAPLRSIRQRVRWNPDWIRNPEGFPSP